MAVSDSTSLCLPLCTPTSGIPSSPGELGCTNSSYGPEKADTNTQRAARTCHRPCRRRSVTFGLRLNGKD